MSALLLFVALLLLLDLRPTTHPSPLWHGPRGFSSPISLPLKLVCKLGAGPIYKLVPSVHVGVGVQGLQCRGSGDKKSGPHYSFLLSREEGGKDEPNLQTSFYDDNNNRPTNQ